MVKREETNEAKWSHGWTRSNQKKVVQPLGKGHRSSKGSVRPERQNKSDHSLSQGVRKTKKKKRERRGFESLKNGYMVLLLVRSFKFRSNWKEWRTRVEGILTKRARRWAEKGDGKKAPGIG